MSDNVSFSNRVLFYKNVKLPGVFLSGVLITPLSILPIHIRRNSNVSLLSRPCGGRMWGIVLCLISCILFHSRKMCYRSISSRYLFLYFAPHPHQILFLIVYCIFIYIYLWHNFSFRYSLVRPSKCLNLISGATCTSYNGNLLFTQVA